jgi:hypothetical protein
MTTTTTTENTIRPDATRVLCADEGGGHSHAPRRLRFDVSEVYQKETKFETKFETESV